MADHTVAPMADPTAEDKTIPVDQIGGLIRERLKISINQIQS